MSAFYPADFDTSTWKRMQAFLEEDLADCRRILEGQALDEKPTQTVRLRARIELLKKLLALPETARKAVEDNRV